MIEDIPSKDIDILIEILPLVNEKTTNTIVPILRKIRKNPRYSPSEYEIEIITKWNIQPQNTKKFDGTKAGKALVYIILKNIGFKI